MKPLTGLVILDGPDGVGKTTLGKELAERFGGKYFHLTYRFKKNMFAYHTAVLYRAARLSTTQLVVIDRLWLSEICYANAYRGGSQWPLMWRMMERVIHKICGIHVVCLPVNPREYLEHYARLKETRNELFSDTLPVYLEYYHQYQRMKTWSHVLRYDMFSDNVDVTIGKIRNLLIDRVSKQDPFILNPANMNVLGHIDSAEFIIVGDITNPHKSKKTWWPFYDYAGSSLHLAQIFDQLGFDESKFLWANARGTPETARYLLARYELKSICLGDIAYRHVCKNAGDYFRHGKPHWLRHPAYEMRFFRDRPTLPGLLSAIYYWPKEDNDGEAGFKFRAPVEFDAHAFNYEKIPGNRESLASYRG